MDNSAETNARKMLDSADAALPSADAALPMVRLLLIVDPDFKQLGKLMREHHRRETTQREAS